MVTIEQLNKLLKRDLMCNHHPLDGVRGERAAVFANAIGALIKFLSLEITAGKIAGNSSDALQRMVAAGLISTPLIPVHILKRKRNGLKKLKKLAAQNIKEA